VTSGWQPSDLVIIAARPGMGKCLAKGGPPHREATWPLVAP
ncbi:MAG: hypothetical protein EOO40_05485, partial [Deltaproteobacteria bacterium]